MSVDLRAEEAQRRRWADVGATWPFLREVAATNAGQRRACRVLDADRSGPVLLLVPTSADEAAPEWRVFRRVESTPAEGGLRHPWVRAFGQPVESIYKLTDEPVAPEWVAAPPVEPWEGTPQPGELASVEAELRRRTAALHEEHEATHGG